MAKTTKPKAPKKVPETLTDADNPSLIKAGEEIRLRVFDDFFIEKDLPKWKDLTTRFDTLCEKLKVRYKGDDYIQKAIKALQDPEEQKKLEEERLTLKKMKKQLEDDRWNIQKKHEDSVTASILKTVRLTFEQKPSWKDKLKVKLHLGKPAPTAVPVDIAFEELKTHIATTSTSEMAAANEELTRIEKRMRDSGQYVKADRLKLYFEDMAAQAVLIKAGFTSYLEEQTLIDFVKKSERGTRVEFLRYYEGTLPDDVLEKKKAADALKVFDNYVIAYYDDTLAKKKTAVAAAEKIKKEKKKEEADKVVERRRDPILFGIIKGVRRLWFIADWVIPEVDDLTMETVEKLLGIKHKDLTEDPASSILGEPNANVMDEVDRRHVETAVRRTSSTNMRWNAFDDEFSNTAYTSSSYINSPLRSGN